MIRNIAWWLFFNIPLGRLAKRMFEIAVPYKKEEK